MPHEFDSLVYEFQNVLREYSIIGYHCTKLTDNEITDIRNNGLRLQNENSLNMRIRNLTTSGLITNEVAQLLMNKNQANASNRANMLWFCFYEPHLAGIRAIERFFISWGGEALYNSHESHPVTGNILRDIGIPCIVEASVPIASLKETKYPVSPIASMYLAGMGYKPKNPVRHEAYSITNIVPNDIEAIYTYPDQDFIDITGFNQQSL